MSDHPEDERTPMNGDVSPSDESRGDTHDESRDGMDVEPVHDVTGAALDALSPDEEAAILAAAMNDPELSAELAVLRNTAAELARLAPTHGINRGRSAGMRSRLLARAAATRIGRTPRVAPTDAERVPSHEPRREPVRVTPPRPAASAPHHPQSARPTGSQRTIPYEQPAWRGPAHPMRWVAIAAMVIVAAIGVYVARHMTITRGNNEPAVATRETLLGDSVAQLRAQLATRDSTIAALTGMHTQVIDLVSSKSFEPMARMFWNQRTAQWTIYATHMQRPSAGKTYQIWLIARGRSQPISAGTFMPDQSGSAVMTAKYDLAPGMLRRIAITEEPYGGMPAPTGQVMFAGVGR